MKKYYAYSIHYPPSDLHGEPFGRYAESREEADAKATDHVREVFVWNKIGRELAKPEFIGEFDSERAFDKYYQGND